MVDIGYTLPKGKIAETETYRMTSSGSMDAMYQINIDKINYVFSVDKSRIITYIETKDENFVTKEGLKIGMSYDEVLKYTDSELQLEKGWAYVLPLSEGWHAAFELSKENLTKITSNPTVKWFFKRK